MLVPVLATKLYVPSPPPRVVLRPRLVERLNEGRDRKLILVSAPAGSGKTTLVSEWVAGCDMRVAWLSLDEADSDLTRFLTYFVAALRTIAPNIGESVLGALSPAPSSPPQPPNEALLVALLNEIAGIADSFVLVLDDYHVIDAPARVSGDHGSHSEAAGSQGVDQALTFLLEHMPPQMHVAITTREDPQLPLSRFRVRGQLTELRAGDLRFTPSEAAGFLATMGLNLSAEDVATLEARTEGWIAGLQLAALSMQNHQDISGFIRAFAGDHRYIVDYLVEEVLQRQPESTRRFLLQTSILDRLNGPLCDAVTGQQGGSARLEALERGNFFVVPLDDKRHWYRYHHLFADVLYAYLLSETAEQPDQLATLHLGASEWYEHHGSAADAIRHALGAGAFERAATIVELAIPELRRTRQEATFLAWLKALPDDVVRLRPVLNANYAGVLLATGTLDGVEARLRDAERWLENRGTTADDRPVQSDDSAGRDRMVVVDEAAFRHLPGSIAVWRAGLALVQGDVQGTVKYARQALDFVSEDDHLVRGGAVGLLGLAYWASGDLEAAYQTFADGMASVRKAGFISDTINSAMALADIRIGQGRLRDAMRTYERALQLATQTATTQGDSILSRTADLYVGMSELERVRNDLQVANEHLVRSKELGERTGFTQNQSRWCVAMSRIREAQGDFDDALDLLGQAERLYVSDFFPNVRPVAALRARVWIAQGMLDEALAWSHAQGLSADDNLSYLREFEYITLARLLLARYRSERTERSISDATGLLGRLLKAAEEGGRTGSVIEILILQALAHHAQGDTPGALVPLERALALAAPEGYVRMFVDEGVPMAQLLQEAVTRRIMPEYAGRLLAALRDEQQESIGESPLPTSQPLPEPLSQRELEVLRLFQTELTGPEIANELVIALSTLRTHTKSIYSKLNVNSRRAAVKRAAELGLM